MRKKNQSKESDQIDEQKVLFQQKLLLREKEEIEEKKKRIDDEEESKYDVSSFLAEAKRWRGKGGKFNFHRRPYNSISSSKALLAAGTSALRKI